MSAITPVFVFTGQAKAQLQSLTNSAVNYEQWLDQIAHGKGVAGRTHLDTLNLLHYGCDLWASQPRTRPVPCQIPGCRVMTGNVAAYCDTHYRLPAVARAVA